MHAKRKQKCTKEINEVRRVDQEMSGGKVSLFIYTVRVAPCSEHPPTHAMTVADLAHLSTLNNSATVHFVLYTIYIK